MNESLGDNGSNGSPSQGGHTPTTKGQHTSDSKVNSSGWTSPGHRRVTPEEVARLEEEFYECLIIPDEELTEGVKEWENALIGKFLGR